MSDTDDHMYEPKSGVELNLLTNGPSAGSEWDANAQTHLTQQPQGQHMASLDFVPGSLYGLQASAASLGGGGGFDGGAVNLVSEPPGDEINGGQAMSRLGRLLVVTGLSCLLGAIFWVGLTLINEDDAYLLSYIMDKQASEVGFSKRGAAIDTPATKLAPSNTTRAKQASHQESKPLADGAQALEGRALLLEATAPPSLPYLYIPKILPAVAPLDRVWNAEEDESWRSGITHRFAWQRYKTVLEVRRARLTQSNIILWDALDDPKFWVRMRAVMGLAEFGVPVSLNNIRKAIGDATVSMQAHFFKRFHRSTPAERFVLQQALTLVSPPVRRIILAALIEAGDASAGVFLTAALGDMDASLRRWALGRLKAYPQTEQRQWAARYASLKEGPLPTALPEPVVPVASPGQPIPKQEAKPAAPVSGVKTFVRPS